METKMKTLLKIAVVAILAFFAFSCKKEEQEIPYVLEYDQKGIETIPYLTLWYNRGLAAHQSMSGAYYTQYYPFLVANGEFSTYDTVYHNASYWLNTQNYLIDSTIMTQVTMHGQSAILQISGSAGINFAVDTTKDVHISLTKDWKKQDYCTLPIGWIDTVTTVDVHVIVYAHTTYMTSTKMK